MQQEKKISNFTRRQEDGKIEIVCRGEHFSSLTACVRSQQTANCKICTNPWRKGSFPSICSSQLILWEEKKKLSWFQMAIAEANRTDKAAAKPCPAL